MGKEPLERVDRFGAVASSLCALHCALCAFLPVIFAVLGLGFLLTHEAEWLLNIIAILFGSWALGLAWRTHRSGRVVGLLLVGILGLLVSRGLEMAAHSDHHGETAHTDPVENAHTDEGSEGVTDGHLHDQHDDMGEEHGDDEHDESDDLHVLGASLGVFSGLLLFFGHLLNIRRARSMREDEDVLE